MKPDSSSTVTMDDNDIHDDDDEMPSIVVSGRASPAFITVENERGVLEHVQVITLFKTSINISQINTQPSSKYYTSSSLDIF